MIPLERDKMKQTEQLKLSWFHERHEVVERKDMSKEEMAENQREMEDGQV